VYKAAEIIRPAATATVIHRLRTGIEMGSGNRGVPWSGAQVGAISFEERRQLERIGHPAEPVGKPAGRIERSIVLGGVIH